MEQEEKTAPNFVPSIDGDYVNPHHFYEPQEEHSIRWENPDAENGYDECRGPLDWLNSARITLDPESDAVHCAISVGDPRGAFGFTVRRLTSGEIVIHTPYPGEGMAHMETRQEHPGTLIVVHRQDQPETVNFNHDDD